MLLVWTGGVAAQCTQRPTFTDAPLSLERGCSDLAAAHPDNLPTGAAACYEVIAATGTLVESSLTTALRNVLVAGGGIPLATSPCGGDLEICVTLSPLSQTDACAPEATYERTFSARNTAANATPQPTVLTQTVTFLRPALADLTVTEQAIYYRADDGDPVPVNPSPRAEDRPTFGGGLTLYDGCGLSLSFTDEDRREGCGNNFSFVRTYVVDDQCTGDRALFTQLVRVGDQQTTIATPPEQVQSPLRFTTAASCAAVIDTRLTGLTVADVCNGNSRLEAFVYLNGDFSTEPLGPYLTFGTDEAANFTAPLPVGQHVIRYLGQDSYGAPTLLDIDLEVVDRTSPTAVCRPLTPAFLGADGRARIPAAALDGGSTDECSAVTFELRRLGTTAWRSELLLTCADPDSVRVALRAVDLAGNNRRSCVATVLVRDGVAPNCTAPDAAVLTCRTFAANLPPNLIATFTADPEGTGRLLDDYFGEATATDNCPEIGVSQTLSGGLSECGSGRFVRSFTATDGRGLTQPLPCRQELVVTPYTDYTLRLPGDRTYGGCGDLPVPEELVSGTEGCDLVTATAQTDTLANDGTACYRLRLTYEFINWCEYDGGSDPITLPRGAAGDVRTDAFLHLLPGDDFDRLDDRAQLDFDAVRDNGNELAEALPDYGSSVRRGYFTYEQQVRIVDDRGPELTLAADVTGVAATDDCEGNVLLPFVATDDCATPTLAVAVDVNAADRNGDDTITGPDFLLDREVPSTRIAANPIGGLTVDIAFLPIGEHLVRIVATDRCGNATVSYRTVAVTDARPPQPQCVPGTTVNLVPDPALGGAASVFVADVIAGPAFVCSPTEVRYGLYRAADAQTAGFTPSATSTSVSFDCSDRGANVLRLYALSDRTNLTDYCNVVVEVVAQEPALCAGRDGSISGFLRNQTEEPLVGVTVYLTFGQQELTTQTNADGFYAFDGLLEGDDYGIFPYYNRDVLNGVTTFDVSRILQYMEEEERHELTPYDLIAADANRSGAITITDLLEIREVLLGIDDDFDDNTSWRFVAADYVFPDPDDPWSEAFPEAVAVDNLSGDHLIDFVGVKVGDVNGSARPPAGLRANPGPVSNLSLASQSPYLSAASVSTAYGATDPSRIGQILPARALRQTTATVLSGSDLRVFPNPAQGRVWLTGEWPQASDISLHLRDSAGRSIAQRSRNVAVGPNRISLSLGGLSPGLYFLTVSDNVAAQTLRVMVR